MKHQIVSASLCMALMGGTTHAAPPPLEIKGVAPGGAANSLSNRLGWSCEPFSPSLGSLCSSRTETLAGAKTKAIFAKVWKERVVDVTVAFNATDFLDIRGALISKYGAPKTSPEDPTTIFWTDGNRTLEMKLHSALGEMTSTLTLRDKNSARLQEAMEQAKARKNKGDL